jgi:hypothetical protein
MMAVRSGNVIYIDHFEMLLIFQKYFIEVAKGRPYEIVLKTKISKQFYPTTLPLQVLINIRSNHMKGEKLAIFNEAGFRDYLEVIHPK